MTKQLTNFGNKQAGTIRKTNVLAHAKRGLAPTVHILRYGPFNARDGNYYVTIDSVTCVTRLSRLAWPGVVVLERRAKPDCQAFCHDQSLLEDNWLRFAQVMMV